MEIYLGRRETLEVEKTIMTTNSIIKKQTLINRELEPSNNQVFIVIYILDNDINFFHSHFLYVSTWPEFYDRHTHKTGDKLTGIMLKGNGMALI